MDVLYGRELTPQEKYKMATDSEPLKNVAGEEVIPEAIIFDPEEGITYFLMENGRVLGSNSATVKKCVDIMMRVHGSENAGLKFRPEFRTNPKSGRDFIFLAYL